MGKPRIRGQHVKLEISVGNDLIDVGEISKMSVKELGELKKNRSIGDARITANKTFDGYDLSFEGGKVDWKLARLMHEQDIAIVAGERAPYFQVKQTFTYYGSSAVEVYTYPEVTIHGYNLDIDAGDELQEKFEGFCGVEKSVGGTSGGPSTDSAKFITYIDSAIAYALTRDSDTIL